MLRRQHRLPENLKELHRIIKAPVQFWHKDGRRVVTAPESEKKQCLFLIGGVNVRKVENALHMKTQLNLILLTNIYSLLCLISSHPESPLYEGQPGVITNFITG